MVGQLPRRLFSDDVTLKVTMMVGLFSIKRLETNIASSLTLWMPWLPRPSLPKLAFPLPS